MLHLNLAKKPGISIHQNKAGCRQPALFFTLPKKYSALLNLSGGIRC